MEHPRNPLKPNEGLNGAPQALTKDSMANTKTTENKAERKKLKRAARKKAAPKAKRTTARGAQKKKIKKASRGVSKR